MYNYYYVCTIYVCVLCITSQIITIECTMLTVAQLKVEIIMFFKNNSVHDRVKSITQFSVGKGFWKSHCHPASLHTVNNWDTPLWQVNKQLITCGLCAAKLIKKNLVIDDPIDAGGGRRKVKPTFPL